MIHLRGKDMLFIEAHGHVWKGLHGIRYNTCTVEPLPCGKVRMGEEVIQFIPVESTDSVFSYENFKVYEETFGFDKTVLLQTPCYGEQYDYINSIIEANPGKYVTTGLANPQVKKEYLKAAHLCLDEYKYKGLKFESPDTPFDMLDPANAFVFEEILKRNAYFMLDLGWGDGPNDFPVEDMLGVAKRYPELKIILPHMGVSRMWDPKESETLDSMKKTLSILEYNENVYFDCSGIPMLATRAGQEYPYPLMQNVLKTAKEMGAINRVMWGSDIPTVLVACTYAQHIECVTRHCDFLTDEELENLMGKTADRVWFN